MIEHPVDNSLVLRRALFWRFAAFVPAIAVTLGTAQAASGPISVAGEVANAPRHLSPPAPPVIPGGAHSNLGSGQTYTIADVGAPPATTFSHNGRPAAFNNAGQILGQAESAKKVTDDCVLYAGRGTFIDVSPSMTDTVCYGTGLSSPDSNGTVRFVGSLATAFVQDAALFGTLDSSGKIATTAFTSNQESALGGVNVSGEAIGAAYYLPLGGFDSSYPPFVVAAGTKTLGIAQPYCVKVAQYCAEPLQTVGSCPFGGCTINDSDTVLALDSVSEDFMVYTPGPSPSGQDLPAIKVSGQTGILDMNNADQILYSTFDATGTHISSAIYAIGHGITTPIPTIPGNSCSDYVAESLSNAGQVLGYTQNCKKTADEIYWTWDPANGTQNLNAEIPSNSYHSIAPLGVNDNGQILVSLVTAAGSYDWGTLNPPATATSTRLRRRASTPLR